MLLDSLNVDPGIFIRVDGTSTTTASIPFAQGLSVPINEIIGVGAASIFADSTYLYFSSGFSTSKSIKFSIGNATGDIVFEGVGGQTYYYASGGIEHLIPSTAFFSVQDSAIGPNYFRVDPSANRTSSLLPTTVTSTSTSAFLVENASGTDRFLVDTSTPKIDLLAPTNIGVAGTTAYNFDIHQNASGKGIFWRPANTGTNPQLEYIGKDGLTSHIKVSAANTSTVSSWVLFDIQPTLSGTVGRGISLPINIALTDTRTINASGLGFDANRLFPLSISRTSGFSSNQSGIHQLAGLYMTLADAGTYSVSTGAVTYQVYGMTAELGGMSPVFSATSGTNTLEFSLMRASGGGSWGGGNSRTTLAFRLIDLNDTYTQISGFAGAGLGGFHYGIHYRPAFTVISGGAVVEAALRADRSGIQLISDGTAGTYSGGNLMMGASLDWDRFYEADNEAVENIPTGAVYDWRINAVDQMSLGLRSLTLGDNTANDFSITFNQGNDATVHWDNTDKAFYTETNGASEFIYPTYGAGFVINDRNITAGTSRFATQFWTTAASSANSTSEVGAFWGGFHDSGSSTPSLAGIYGLVPFNYFAGTNARTYTTIWGLYAGNEFDAVTQITATDIYGAFIDPLATGGSGSIASATNIYGVSINAPTATATGAVTNWYGLRIGTSAIATNNYSIFLNTTGILAFRNANHTISSPSSGILRVSANTTVNLWAGGVASGFDIATFSTTAITVTDAINFVLGTTTGTIFGSSSSQKIGFWGTTAIARPSAYTQTYSTATRTHANVTSASLSTTAATNIAPWGFATQAQADAIATQVNATQADLLNLKQLVNQILDDLQLVGLAA